ncbi:ArsR/SmtB family transcription factor [Tomitella gaofuii]|uniref:ArsR/SmtB family transcription factor n=1 Tax=Tomitella gaofuii TaxID=2760083 RepID=UPI0015FA3D45|nr:winged helix-turn-helix domain-containing protein [Tomitella gaofuii]
MSTARPLSAPRTPDLSGFAREVADPSRSAMLVTLMDGRAWTVGELARQAGIARNTASGHVRRLVRAGLVTESRQGRHCYLTLAAPQVADAIEAIGLATGTLPPTRSLRGRRFDDELAAGRTCYRHLAGRLGVGLLDGAVARGLVTGDCALTDHGRAWCEAHAIDTAPSRRPLLRPCIDWTERRPHLAGALADRLAAAAFDRGWIVRGSHPRAVRFTPTGRSAIDA